MVNYEKWFNMAEKKSAEEIAKEMKELAKDILDDIKYEISNDSITAKVLSSESVNGGIYAFMFESVDSFHPGNFAKAVDISSNFDGGGYDGEGALIEGKIEKPGCDDAVLFLINHEGILMPLIFYIDDTNSYDPITVVTHDEWSELDTTTWPKKD